MRRHSLAPILILCALAGLALGGAALGIVQAPSSTDVAVHNAIGETLAAPNFSLVSALDTTGSQGRTITHLTYTAPDRVVVVTSANSVTRTTVTKGTTATAKVLEPISTLTSFNNFTEHHGVYVAAAAPATLAEQGASVQVALSIANGYLTSFIERITLNTSQQEAATFTTEFSKIGDWNVNRP